VGDELDSEAMLRRISHNMAFADPAAIPIVFSGALHGLRTVAKVQRGVRHTGQCDVWGHCASSDFSCTTSFRKTYSRRERHSEELYLLLWRCSFGWRGRSLDEWACNVYRSRINAAEKTISSLEGDGKGLG
jgi:hypothetical protein